MAVTIPIPPGAPPIDQLVAVGLRTAAGDLADLLDEQAYTVGVEILPDGTATNNTGQTRAGFSPAHDANVAAELIADGTAAVPAGGSAGAQLAQLLGFNPGRLSRTAGAHTPRAEVPAATRLLVGLAATGSMAQAAGPTAAGAWTLVFPGGPAPALRIGLQPYGVLPATVAARWIPATGEAGAGAATLLARWASAHIARVDVDPADPPMAHHLPGMSRPATSPRCSTCWANPRTARPGRMARPSMPGWMAWSGRPRERRPLTPTSERLPLQLRLTFQASSPSLPDALLARIGLIAKQSAAASDIAAVDAALTALGNAAQADAGRGQLAAALTSHLDALSHRADAWITAVARRAARRPAGLGRPQRHAGDRCLRLPQRRRTTHRCPQLRARARPIPRAGSNGGGSARGLPRATPNRPGRGAASGGDGPRPGSRRAERPRPGRDYRGAADRSRRLAPSRRTALAAERAGLAANAPLDAASEASLTLAIDLSSRRVRSARVVLAAVRGGQPLGAVLGYQFERDLADAGLTRYLAAFRKLTRFQTGTALEQLENARRQAQQQPRRRHGPADQPDRCRDGRRAGGRRGSDALQEAQAAQAAARCPGGTVHADAARPWTP